MIHSREPYQLTNSPPWCRSATKIGKCEVIADEEAGIPLASEGIAASTGSCTRRTTWFSGDVSSCASDAEMIETSRSFRTPSYCRMSFCFNNTFEGSCLMGSRVFTSKSKASCALRNARYRDKQSAASSEKSGGRLRGPNDSNETGCKNRIRLEMVWLSSPLNFSAFPCRLYSNLRKCE